MYLAFSKFALLFLAFLIPVALFYLTIRKNIKVGFCRKSYWIVPLFFAVIFLLIRYLTPFVMAKQNILMPAAWLIWVYLLILIPFLLFAVFYWLDLLLNKIFVKKFKFKYFIAIPLIIIFLGFYLQGVFNRFNYEVRHIDLPVENLPQGFDNLKIAVMGNTYLSNLSGNKKYFDNLQKDINAENADLIVFVGNLVNSKGNELSFNWYMSYFQNFKSNFGKYAVMGNHDFCDYYSFKNQSLKEFNIQGVKDTYANIGFNLLENDFVILDRDSANRICIAGTDEKHDFKALAATLPDSVFTILINHSPTIWDEQIVDKQDIMLTLAGQTRTLQCSIKIFGKEFSPASWFFEQQGGLYTKGNQHLAITRGIGYVGIPSRIGKGPDVTIITLKRK
jgi:predicted MPP superfamily phosphohydrolase